MYKIININNNKTKFYENEKIFTQIMIAKILEQQIEYKYYKLTTLPNKWTEIILTKQDVLNINTTKPYNNIGVAVIVLDDKNQVLLLQRKGSTEPGSLGLPGGKLDPGEKWKKCGSRELEEETGLIIPPEELKLFGVTEDQIPNTNIIYTTIILQSKILKTDGMSYHIMEPDKCSNMGMFDPGQHPSPLFSPLQNMITSYGLQQWKPADE